MNQENKPFLKWFGYSRRERRSTFILFIILLVVIGTRYLIPPKDIEIKDLTGLLSSFDSGQDSTLIIKTDTSILFNFNPNSASYDTLIMLGLSEENARTLINYRKKGGRFHQPSDIKKIYGIEEPTSSRLMPLIKIKKYTGKTGYLEVDLSEQKENKRINLNKSDSATLERLPGLGPVLSSRIIKYRKLLGGYVSAEQLREVYGLHEETYNLLIGRVFADSSDIIGININDAGFVELSKHPYLDRYDIKAILKYKELKGRISNISELIKNKILTADKAKRISPYLKF
jgi:competence protein ComEA